MLGPGLDDPEDVTPLDLVTAVRRPHHRLTARLGLNLFEIGVSFAQFELMIALERKPNLHAGELPGCSESRDRRRIGCSDGSNART
jgi:hypothetical protein